MRNQNDEIREKADTDIAGPTMTFSHLAMAGFQDDFAEGYLNPVQNFASSLEESIYETGFLMKTFLKC